MDEIRPAEISAPPKDPVRSNCIDEARDSFWLFRLLETFTVAKFPGLSVIEVHVNCMTNQMIASSGRRDNGTFYFGRCSV